MDIQNGRAYLFPHADPSPQGVQCIRRVVGFPGEGSGRLLYEALAGAVNEGRIGYTSRGFPLFTAEIEKFRSGCIGRASLLDLPAELGDLKGYDVLEPDLMLLEEAISLGRRDGMAGQHLSAMCSARDSMVALRRALWDVRQAVQGHPGLEALCSRVDGALCA